MCRLFGLHAGSPTTATFWLLDAPDSLAAQSRRNPDGTGIGCFDPDGRPLVAKEPIAAWHDTSFARSACTLTGRTFVAHVRYASTGALTRENTHPFALDGRLFAHNGVVGGLDRLDARLAELEAADLVRGQTDSERVFALVTAETRRHGGDLGAGLQAAVAWVGAELPVYALNLVLATPDELWALRYPDTHELWVLERPVPAADELQVRSVRISAHAPALAGRPAVVVATERMDDDPGWRLLGDGELLRVGPDLRCSVSRPFAAPVHPLRPADLGARAAASQHS
ncbi:glutamine amidotransferase [Friedmanniella endophytica]|uniref:Glutamine amidotransferase n=1 Tax=Microlunatus kandeliicorticis TaxID=1759536 RepID=A0A7W3P6M0_9ACTN|nr:class II glutamine amidotransferase [Microlunatus kandeliicorticis]MBA8795118.1 glutamine amidotransferase [Microlunatus kandeliicorticis]